ncbi:hypothetical protein HX127_06335 [Acinetobacter sp. 256-1]|uniref:hypothetical protein n=1 Tax=Acinetobacter sp. 256-1 TaxID=2746721 RepID=UPI0025781F68|nr:hypothetical protein [Acinetobacter sp. 256-1]MDM1757202.1 hypothetical protein [Acinetobacter sp. 256-1]
MYGLKKRSKQDESGLIQGAGTGTSDDVKKNVPAGSYIMPADSTAQLGARNLKNLGKPPTTEVNVSNGEYLASPEQLQAIGGLTLDRLKQATHTPVDQPQLGFKPGQNKPELFFANGTSASGVPDDDAFWGIKKSAFAGNALGQPKNQTPVPQQQNTQTQATAPQKSNANFGLGEFDLGFRMPEMNSKQVNPINTFSSAFSTGENKSVPTVTTGVPDDDTFWGIKKSAFTGNALGQPKNQTMQPTTNTSSTASQKTPSPVAQVVEQAKLDPTKIPTSTNNQNVTSNTATQAPPKADLFDLNSAQTPTTTTQPQANPYEIQQKGNAFSYTNPNAAAQARANGIPELQGSGVQRGVGVQGIKDFMAKTPEMNLGMQGYGGRPRLSDVRTSEQEAQLQAEIARVSAPIAGSRGLTASQRNQINDLQMGYSNRANDVYKTDANNAASLQRETMGQSAQNYRAELGEQGANNRFNSNLNLEAQKFNATNDLANRQFSADQLDKMPARMKQAYELNLLKQYEAAQTPEERQSLAERLGMVRGQQSERGGSRIMAISGGETIDEKGNIIKNPDVLINNQTGQRLDSMQSKQQNVPQIGSVINGYKYKGGDFNKPESWEKA